MKTGKRTSSGDKQLRGIRLNEVLDKRRKDMALNVKEFAVASAISYSSARSWFRLPGFPAVKRMIFWSDFERWRWNRNLNADNSADSVPAVVEVPPTRSPHGLPARAQRNFHPRRAPWQGRCLGKNLEATTKHAQNI